MFSIREAKGNFFDRSAVTRRVDVATRRVLSKFGAFVRRRARSSIRKRKRVSRPGEAPTSQTGLLRNWILFSYEPASNSVVIGPAALREKQGNAPEVLEHGGSIVTSKGGRISIQPRPYMGPALEKELPGLPRMWQDSVR